MFKRRKPEDSQESGADTAAPAETAGRPFMPPAPASAPASDTGIPPFRPAGAPVPLSAPLFPAKETPMARSPFSSTPPQPAPTGIPAAPPRPAAPTMPAGQPPVGGPGPGMTRAPAAPAERRTLVVGRGISLQGTVQDAERLVVEGTVEASMIHAAELSIAHGGVFKGEVEVEDAEIAGTIDGTLTARGNLVVRASGRVLGTARYRRLTVEDGGQLTGRLEMLTETTPLTPPRAPEPAPRPAVEPAV
jgi:cytoskeletal protein CcmA (bactofilin family)